MVNIRKAKVEDLRQVQSLATDTIDKCYRSFLGDEAVDYFISSGESDKEVETHLSNCTVLEVAEEIKGYCVSFDDFIHILMVSPDLQRTGLGSHFLTSIEKELFSKGNKTIRLETFKNNKQAVNFYKKNGWLIEREEEDESFGFVRVFMVKNA